jgi:hypothetical protein
MMGPSDPVKGQQDLWTWEELRRKESLFPGIDEETESTDLIVDLNAKIEELEDLCGRLSFAMREISQVLKIKST